MNFIHVLKNRITNKPWRKMVNEKKPAPQITGILT